MRKTTRQRGNREETEARILAAAEEVFSLRGYAEATIAEMLERSRLARGTFYLYFDDKRSVFAALLDRAMTDLFNIVAPPDGMSYRDRVRHSTEAYMKQFLLHRGVLRCMFETSTSDAELLAETNRNRMRSVMRVASHLERQLHPSRRASFNPVLTSYCLCAIIEGTAYQWFCAANHPTTPRIEDIDDLVDTIADIWCCYVYDLKRPARPSRPADGRDEAGT